AVLDTLVAKRVRRPITPNMLIDQLARSLPRLQPNLARRRAQTAVLWPAGSPSAMVEEPTPTRRALSHLTEAEAALHHNLIEDRLGSKVPLEQERVRFSLLRQHWYSKPRFHLDDISGHPHQGRDPLTSRGTHISQDRGAPVGQVAAFQRSAQSNRARIRSAWLAHLPTC
ncbi:MAG: DUF2220 domain-containing protein, partial [Ilumatobacteraceae bacterium]|nr:DUF2220 domain-containing protein [Ilumatobacteraceae bacterium]